METLYGTWRITHLEQKSGAMLEIATPTMEFWYTPTYATFNSDGTFSGRGLFGNGSGTYKAQGKTVTCFIDGQEFMKYKVISLSKTECELEMSPAGSSTSTKIRCKKQ